MKVGGRTSDDHDVVISSIQVNHRHPYSPLQARAHFDESEGAQTVECLLQVELPEVAERSREVRAHLAPVG
eukprot:765270-Hanusia_phi.AAC.6